MSSEAVRQAVFTAVSEAAAPWSTYDLSDYLEIGDVTPGPTSHTVLVQYATADEQQMNIAAEGNQGWEETGVAVVHVLTPVGFDSLPVIQKCDEIKKAIRGRRVGSVVMESCTPFTDFGGPAIGIEGSFKTFSASMFYYNRDCG